MIKIENLSVAFEGAEVVKNVTIEIADGEIVGVVGESGSGKSVTALTLMGLSKEDAVITKGRILFEDVVLAEAGKPKNKALYRKYQGDEMTMIFQEPMTSLNPTQRVGMQVEEVLKLHTKMSKEERKAKVLETFSAVGLKDAERVYRSYPHQLSGGMRQRAMIAMAIILKPKLLVADEPTTALDVTVQNQIITLLKEINEVQQNAMLFITHDLNLARRLCDKIVVMKDGEIVESGTPDQIFNAPREAYTKRLIEAVPSRMTKKIKHGSAEEILRVEHLNVFYPNGDNSLFSRKEKKNKKSACPPLTFYLFCVYYKHFDSTRSQRDSNRGISSVGRATGWQPVGQRFEPAILH